MGTSMAVDLKSTLNGDNLTAHAATAVTIGGSVSVIVIWIISLFHVQVPDDVAQAFTAISTFIASYTMQKVGG